jgi:hypothetical protein
MLNADDRNAIEGLFRRLEEAERRGGPRDTEAEDLIGRLVRRQPAAPYYLAQTVVVQQEALTEAERRIGELEEQLSRRAEPDRRRNPWGDPTPANYAPPQYDRGYGQNVGYGGFGGGGFLAGAAQTALGVAGGMLLGSMIGSVFSAGSAHAADTFSHDANDGGNESPQDAGSGNDAGGSDNGPGDSGGFGDGGGFDGGGFDTGGGF